jgi:glycolate oxidase iron-sulfur subunit
LTTTSAWDSTRPPEPDLIDDCVHCGFCLPTCPTYTLWQEEMDSPRGRIVLMRAAGEEGSELSAPLVQHLDNCLGCMACVTACPSGVQYDKLIEDARAQVERNWDRPMEETLLRKAIFAVFPHPKRLRFLVPGMWLQSKIDFSGLTKRPRLRKLAPLLDLTPRPKLSDAVATLPSFTAARGEARGEVAFLQGCVQRVLFSGVNKSTVEVLAAEGYDVHSPRAPECCGALELHSGVGDSARARARAVIQAYEKHATVLVNAAGCGSAMKDYGHVLRDDPEWADRAERFAAKVQDVTEFLAGIEPRAERKAIGLSKIAYHDACHLAHAQGVRSQPRELLRAIPGLEVVDPPGWEICCGSAGIYNLTKPEPAAELGRRKVANLRTAGAEAIVAANPGCAIQIAAHSERDGGPPLRVLHPLELLHKSIQGGS